MLLLLLAELFSAYSVYHKKHQKQLAKQSEVQREKDVNTARKKAQKEKTTLKPWYTYHSIAHAMGGLDGKDYLNSSMAFTLLIRRVIVSLKWTSFLLRTTLRLGSTNGLETSDPTSKKGDPVSYRKFKNTKIYGKYTPTSFLDVLNLMEKYPDFYLMTDSKSTEPADAKKEFNVLVQTAKKVGKEDLLRPCDRSGLQSENVLGCKKRASIQALYTPLTNSPMQHFIKS